MNSRRRCCHPGSSPTTRTSQLAGSQSGRARTSARSRVMGPVDTTPVWSVVCFVVPSAWRRRGVAGALLRGAVEHAAHHGARWLEAYPIDKPGPSADNWLWHGTKAMFDQAGFEEVLRRKPERPIMWRRIRPLTGNPSAGRGGAAMPS